MTDDLVRNTLSLLPPVAMAPKLSRAWNTLSLLPPVAMAPKLPRSGNLSVSPLAHVPWLSVGLGQESSNKLIGGASGGAAPAVSEFSPRLRDPHHLHLKGLKFSINILFRCLYFVLL